MKEKLKLQLNQPNKHIPENAGQLGPFSVGLSSFLKSLRHKKNSRATMLSMIHLDKETLECALLGRKDIV